MTALTWGNTRAQRLKQWLAQILFGIVSTSVGRVTFCEAWTGRVERKGWPDA